MRLLNVKQSFRNLGRNKVYSLVNGAGLGVSGAFILLVVVYISHALKMDKFSPALHSIYRVETSRLWSDPDTSKKGFFDWLTKDAAVQKQLVTPLVLGEDLQKNFPEVRQFCRVQNDFEPVVLVGNKRFKEDGKHIAYVDKNFFSLFDLPLLTAKKEAAFPDNHSVVLSETAARKYFGNDSAVGKVISLRGGEQNLFTVSAIAKDFPYNSSMQFDVIFCLQGQTDYAERLQSGLNQSSFLTMLQLKEGTNVLLFERKLATFGEKYLQDWVETGRKYNPEEKDLKVNLAIRPFSESHFNSSSPWFYFTDAKSLYQLSLLALIALGIACLNYVLLSLSRVAVRSHEAGVRKTVGAGWKNIVSLFLTETAVMVLLSMLVGFVLAVIALPVFNKLTGVTITVAELINLQFISVAFLLTLVLTFVAGIYPAIQMAGIKPLNVLSKFGTYKVNPSLSKIFIALQYTACIVLIVFSIVIARQIVFMNNKDLGFDKAQTVVVLNPFWGDKEKTLSLRSRLQSFAASQPAFAGITGATFRYGTGSNRNGHTINGTKEMINDMTVDYDYFEFNKIPIVKGRSFSRSFLNDTSRMNIAKELLDSLNTQTRSNMVVNETLYNELGQPPLNEFNRPLGGYIVGVCKDYFTEGLQQKISPAYHRCRPGALGYFWLRIGKGQNLPDAMNKLKAQFSSATNGEDFTYHFMDDDVKALYESHERWLKIIGFASWMSILIACLGLFGLSAVVAVNRTKEIGIRKVLGATVTQLFYTLNKQSLTIVALSVLIAVPVAGYVSNNWLENFAYRIHLSWVFFAVGAFIGFACALLAVSYHTLKAAKSNPVKSLRSE